MKKKTLLMSLTLLSTFAFSTVTYGHEIWQSYPLRWIHRDSVGRAKLDVNGDYLKAPFKDNLGTAINNWQNSNAYVSAFASSFSGSTVDFVTPSSWKWGSGLVGLCINVDTNGKEITSESAAATSTRQIRYARVEINADPYSHPTTEAGQEKVLTHELGHTLGLGHPVYGTIPTHSIMKQGWNGYSTVQQHDVDDVNSWY